MEPPDSRALLLGLPLFALATLIAARLDTLLASLEAILLTVLLAALHLLPCWLVTLFGRRERGSGRCRRDRS